MFGVTPEGFTRKPFTQIQSEMQAYLRAKISKHLQLTEKTGLGNVLNAAGDQLAEGWEALEAAYHGFDKDNALADAFVALCELTGTKRRGATKGAVLATCNFAGSATYAAGALIAHVDGKSSNRWVNRDVVVVTTPGNYLVIFNAETAGVAGVAVTGTLTEIAQPVSGWNSVTNAIDATPGTDIESLEDLYVRREQEMAAAGSGTLNALRSAVSKVAGVIQVRCFENKTDIFDAFGLPPHSFQVVIFDGISPAANNDEVAQAILSSGPAGIPSVGSSSGTATDQDGIAQTLRFTRAAQIPIYVSINVDGSTVGVAAAIVKEGNKLNMGDDVIREKLKGAAVVLPGVTDIATCTLGMSPSPAGTANLVIARDQIALFDASRVVVT